MCGRVFVTGGGSKGQDAHACCTNGANAAQASGGCCREGGKDGGAAGSAGMEIEGGQAAHAVEALLLGSDG